VPGDDLLGEHVDDERDVGEPGPGPAVGEVHDPRPVRGGGGEVAVQQVTGALAVLARDRGPDPLGTADPPEPQRLHGPIDGARAGVG
jgi:hypothetical protein